MKENQSSIKNSERHRKKYLFLQIFWGTLFLAGAVGALLSGFNIITLGINLGWLLIIVFLGAIAITSLFSLSWFSVFLPAAGILTIINGKTDLLNFNDEIIGAIWIAAALLTIGFSILFHKRSYRWSKYHGNNSSGNSTAEKIEDESDIDISARFSGAVRYINTDNFKHANINCDFGSIKAYFDNAKIKGTEATININSSFSGIALFIPKTWRVTNNISCNMGSVDEKNSSRIENQKDQKTLTLTGTINLSGVEIYYV